MPLKIFHTVGVYVSCNSDVFIIYKFQDLSILTAFSFRGVDNSLDVFSLSLSRFFKQYRIKNIWSPPGIKLRTACIAHKCSATELRQPAGKQIFLILYCFKKKPVKEREYSTSNE